MFHCKFANGALMDAEVPGEVHEAGRYGRAD
jgi:hypothetical protein